MCCVCKTRSEGIEIPFKCLQRAVGHTTEGRNRSGAARRCSNGCCSPLSGCSFPPFFFPPWDRVPRAAIAGTAPRAGRERSRKFWSASGRERGWALRGLGSVAVRSSREALRIAGELSALLVLRWRPVLHAVIASAATRARYNALCSSCGNIVSFCGMTDAKCEEQNFLSDGECCSCATRQRDGVTHVLLPQLSAFGSAKLTASAHCSRMFAGLQPCTKGRSLLQSR